jgi:two-component system NtrC family sensor kinase
MRLVFKLTWALVAGMCVVFAGYAYFTVVRLPSLFEEDLRRDLHTIGRALEIGVATLWESAGEQQALNFLALANEREDKTQIAWLPLEERADSSARGIPSELATPLIEGREVFLVDRSEPGPGWSYSYRPVPALGRIVGAIVLSESLAEEAGYIRSRVWRTLGAGALMIVVSGVLASLLGTHLVGRPVQALIDKARRVGAGDFSGPLDPRQRDELGQLAAEINLMTSQLAETNRRLTSETDAKLRALEQLRHAERLTTIGTLAAGIAHELGTPLNVVSGRARLIQESAPSGGEVRHQAEIIVEQVKKMTAIIRQLLDFARRRTPQKASLAFGPLVAQTLDLLRPLARKRGVSLAAASREGEARVRADANQIQQALTNLVMNAVQASPSGATVTVESDLAEASPPDSPGTPPRSYFRVSVQDQGAGIEAEALPRIFEPFFTTKDVGDGTGLGLSVTYGIVSEHGGWIAVESTPGAGTRFSVHLPTEESA